MKQIFLALLTSSLFILSSCSTMKKIALKPTSQIIYDASFEQTVENDWDYFVSSLDGNIKLIEGLHSQSPENKNLIVTLQKAFVAKAFAINETDYLNDFLAEKESSKHLDKALRNYTKALYLGLDFLKVSGVSSDLTKFLSTPHILMGQLNKNLDSDDILDLEGVFFLGQALGSLVNLQRESMKAVAYLPIAKTLIDWTCSNKPDFNYGACDIFYATYESGRPRMLGGDPVKGKKMFLAAIKKWPNNWMVRQSFVQFHTLLMLEEDDFEEQLRFFKINTPKLNKKLIWKGDNFDRPKKNYVSVYNLIALKRMKIIEKYRSDIF